MPTRLTPEEEAEVERILAYGIPEEKPDAPGVFDFPPPPSESVKREIDRILGIKK